MEKILKEINQSQIILDALELAESHLKEDIDFLYDIYNNYFAFNEKSADIERLENDILILTKSMEYNKLCMKEAIIKIYDKN